MTITDIKPATVGLKKAVDPHVVNAEILRQSEKRTKFQQVAAGFCPHDGALLFEPVKTKGIGIKFVCSQCRHTWYINKKIKTCGCLTCKGTKRKSKELIISNRAGHQVDINNSGPLWTRTTDPSLMKNVIC